MTDSEWPSYALFQVVERTAARIFSGKFRPNRTPHPDVTMGGDPPSYDFSSAELKEFSKDVTAAVNDLLTTNFKPQTEVKVGWTYRSLVLKVWSHVADQLDKPVPASMTDCVSR